MHKTKLWVFLVFLASFIIVYQHFIVCINQSEEKFLEWLRANGAEFSSVDLVTLEHYGRGLVSNRFIQVLFYCRCCFVFEPLPFLLD
jgi:hypothetical protein